MCQKAAYIERSRIEFEGNCALSPRVYDYSIREAPIYSNVLLPEGVDENFKVPEVLWNAAERAETKINSQVGIEKVLALPDDKEITIEDRIKLFESFIQRELVDKGLAAHIAIHQPEEGQDHNWHGHVLAPTRQFSEDGKSFNTHKPRELQQELANENWGAKWGEFQNEYFRSLGLALRVDDKALVPENHLGAVRLRGRCLDKLAEHAKLKNLNALEAQDPEKILMAITARQSTFTRDDVDRLMAKHTPSGVIDSVKDAFWKQESIMNLKDKETLKPTENFSSREVIEEEKRILRLCTRLDRQSHFNIKDFSVKRSLNEEQQEAFQLTLKSKGISCIQGYAGTGKSHLLAALKEKYEQHGIKVRGFGPDNATVKLLKEKGFQAENVPKFLHANHHGCRDIGKKEVWVVDEAGKLGNLSLVELLKLANKHHAKVILAGDGNQLSSVDRGGMFKEICKNYDVQTLSDIKRQDQDLDRQIAKSLATGAMGEALDALARKGDIHWHQDTKSSMEALIIDWSKDHIATYNKKLSYVGLPHEQTSLSQEGKQRSYDTSLIVAQTNQEVRDLNEMAHNIRVAKEEISSEEFRCETLFGETLISTGDRIEFRKNDRELGVTNGMSGTLLEASEDRFAVSITESSKKTKLVTFNPKEYSGYQLGYATTCFRAQGRTVKHAYVMHSEYLNKQMAYVGLTRHTKSVNYYVPEDKCKNMAQLKWSAGRDSSKGSTIHYTNDFELQKQAALVARENRSEELAASDNWFNVGRSIVMDATDGVKNFFSKTAEKIQDQRPNKSFYNYKEEKISPSSFAVSRMEESIDKEAVVNKAMGEIEKGHTEKALMTKEIKRQEIGANLEQERQSHPQEPSSKNRNLDQYWKQVSQCKELRVVVEGEKAGGLKDIESSENFKQWMSACSKRNELAYTLKPEEKKGLNEKSLDIIAAQAGKHEAYLKEQEARRAPILNENLKFHIEPLLNKLFPDGPSMKTATTFRFGAKGSLSVTHSGSKAGQFYDFETQEGGGLTKLIEKRLGLSLHETRQWATQFLNIAPSMKISDNFQRPLKSFKKPSNWISERPPVDKTPPSCKDLKMDSYWNEVARHDYRDRKGNLLYQVMRLQDKNNPAKKITPPLSYGHYVGEEGYLWQMKGYKDDSGKAPLYGLEKLDKSPHAVVVVVEGEKAADLGADKFLDKEDYICISWPGGAKAVSKADWTPLEDRKVLVWGDNDEPGRKAQLNVCEELKKLENVAVKAIDYKLLEERNFPDKWDLADALPKNYSEMTIQAIKDDAKEIIGDFDKIDHFHEKQAAKEKFELADQRRIESGMSGLYGAQKLFENERAIVVLCSSPEAADRGAEHFLMKEDHVCVSWNGGAKGTPGHPNEKELDFSVLEGRKVLVWGDHNEPGKEIQQGICDQLKSLDNVAVKSVDHELMDQFGFIDGWNLSKELPKENVRCDFYTCTWIEDEAKKEIGLWDDIDAHYRKLDKERGLDIDRGMER